MENIYFEQTKPRWAEGAELEEEGLVLRESTRYRLIGLSGANWGGKVLNLHPEGGLLLELSAEVGRGVLQVESSGRISDIPVRVLAREQKLPVALWEKMLEDLEAWGPGLSVGAGRTRLGNVGPIGVAAPLIAEALLPLVPSILEDLCRLPMPQAHLRAATGRLGQRDIEALLRRPDLLRVPRWEASEALGWVRQALPLTAARLEQTATGLEQIPEGEGIAEKVRSLRAAAKQLRTGAQNVALLETEAVAVLPPEIPPHLRPLVRRLCLFLSPRFQPRAGPLPAAARPSWQLYELWCLLALQRALAQALPAWQWQAVGLEALWRLEAPGTGAGFIGRGRGQDAGQHIFIDFNPVFVGAHAAKGARRWTLSRPRRPDLTICIDRGQRRWICLDAKWRAGRFALGDAFSSLHLYRDALRDADYGGRCTQAALLAPSESSDVKLWFSQEFLKQYRCGCWELRPGGEALGLADWVLEL